MLKIACHRKIKITFALLRRMDNGFSGEIILTIYYQVQTQLNVCNLPYCDFVVWTEGGSAVERITVDSTFYETVMEDVKHFLSMVYNQK